MRGRGRRGVILILVLGVLGLMAVIGVTFATFTGQARMAGRSFAQSKIQAQSESLMDFALSQLITDTNDVRSAIRGHSLSRDMYGNDARGNGFVAYRSDGQQVAPGNDARFYITRVDAIPAVPGPPPIVDRYYLTTNIQQGDPLFYGYDFRSWTARIAFNLKLPLGSNTVTLPPGATGVINQSFEVVDEDGFIPGSTDPRRLAVVIKPSDIAANLRNASNTNTYYTITPANLFNSHLAENLNDDFILTLDGRWLNAFNGPGQTVNPEAGNFRYNLMNPGATGMDEDYDAVDLQNWFLAMQSADGQVIIPSFHRPAAVRYDPTDRGNIGTPVNDWDVSALPLDRARIFRPRQADGNDPQTFPDLIPNADGKITYDVDNDGDGASDSVWVDLGYPARRNAQGTLYKPLFAFMVIGLNGRIPLNTAGNMAGRGAGGASASVHASHLGNSVSEIDPSYGLQNAFYSGYSQYDNAGLDVRLTQLRNILAGTRPQPEPFSPPDATGDINGDGNYVQMGWVGGVARNYYLPNGKQDAGDYPSTGMSPGNYIRLTPPIAGRWGEPESVPGGLYAPLGPAYQNEVRPGYSITAKDLLNSSVPMDAADDDFNAFDVYPSTTLTRTGEVGDDNFLDAAGALLLPVERICRFLTPIDINGSGAVRRWNAPGGEGGDYWGRVAYNGYYRPAGLPAQTSSAAMQPFPWVAGENYPGQRVGQAQVANNHAHDNNILHGYESFRFPNLGGPAQRSGGTPAYRNLTGGDTRMGVPTTIPTYDSQINATIEDEFVDETGVPAAMVAARSDALNAADELNLYNADNNLDAPFSHADLEWLYRFQDVDSASLRSRLADLAPISFLNNRDGIRRRRLYSIDSWESNSFAWANDNPGGTFGDNSRFTGLPNASASIKSMPTAGYGYTPFTPSLAQRGRKINLNMPLPASNDPREPIRQKWITDAYFLFKSVLPPRAVDTPEELAQLGQYLVNVIDFRDPDCAMTIWDNPDVYLVAAPSTQPTLSFTGTLPLRHYGMEYNPVAINEVLSYSYQRKEGTGSAASPANTGRFFIELVNTLVKPRTGNNIDPVTGIVDEDNNASVINLSGFNFDGPPLTSPYDGGCWDLVFTDDQVDTRPDPFTGQLQPSSNIRTITPLGRNSVRSRKVDGVSTAVEGAILLRPLPRQSSPTKWFNTTGYAAVLGYEFPLGATEQASESSAPTAGDVLPDTTPFQTNGQGSFYTLKREFSPFDLTSAPTEPVPNGVLPRDRVTGAYPVSASLPSNKVDRDLAGSSRYFWVYLRRPANPLAPVSDVNPMVVVDSMRFLNIDSGATVETRMSDDPPNSGRFDVVTRGGNDVYSFQRMQPYRGGQAVPSPTSGPLVDPTTIDPRYGYTEQIAPSITASTIMLKYGDTASNVLPPEDKGPKILRGDGLVRHTLGLPNDTLPQISTNPELWDFFPFNDRDFTSLFELTLVPGVGPGMFTKRFSEFAPSAANKPGLEAAANTPALRKSILTVVTARTTPYSPTDPCADGNTVAPFLFRSETPPVEPHTFPYLVDKFFYTAYGDGLGATDTLGSTVDGYASDGWFKMFEFLEVPSQSNGAIGSVAEGTNFDWARQDVRPGLMNLNLIMDEEAFLALLGRQNLSASPALEQSMNPYLVPNAGDVGLTTFPGGQWTGPLDAGYPSIPMVVTSTLSNGAPGYAYPMPHVGTVANNFAYLAADEKQQMKAAFAQFLWARHGGSGFLFGFGSGNTGQNYSITPPNPAAFTQPLSLIPAEQPFRSPSYPDVGLTVLRPAILKPSIFTDPPYNPPITRDPGVRNNVLNHGYERATPPVSGGGTYFYPPAIPARRFFQPPDAYVSGATPPIPSNAGLIGDPSYNNLTPTTATMPNPASGGLPPMLFPYDYTGTATTANLALTGGALNLFIPGNPTAEPAPPVQYQERVAFGLGGTAGQPSMDQHPYFRSESMQRVMNLTTPRTHQFAVWITIGLFEVVREGDIAMLGNPLYSAAAFDVIGPEIGAATSENRRYRSFFVVDRLKLTGFDPDSVGAFRPAVVYRRTIE